MGKSLTEAAKSILLKEDPTALSATLQPNSTYADPMQGAGYATDDIAQAPTAPGEGENVGAKMARKIKKDQTIPGAVPAEGAGAEVMEEEEAVAGEVMEEDVEISEEVEAFINDLAAQGLSEEEIARRVDEEFEIIEEEIADDYQVDMSEHMAALFAGEELSEEFKQKAQTIFEAAVKAKVEEQLGLFEEAYAATLEEEIEKIQESLTDNIDDYLGYVVENWVSDNEIAIEAGLRTELTEDFISGLRNLFAENYIDMPDDKVSIVEELATKVEQLETKLNEEIDTNVNLSKALNESKKYEIIASSVSGLTDTQAQKLMSLTENINFTDPDNFAKKVKTLRENYFPTGAVKSLEALDTIEPGTEGQTMIAEDVIGPMAKYVAALPKVKK